jgi:hypothetical protein
LEVTYLTARTFQLLLLLLALSSFSSPAKQAGNSSPGWVKTSQSSDASGNTVAHFAATGRFNKPPGGENPSPPSFAVDCRPDIQSRPLRDKFSEGSLRVGTPLKIEWVEPEVVHGIGYYPKVTVRYRLDDSKATGSLWAAGADKSSALFTKDMLKKLLRAKTVMIEVRDNQENVISMHFDLADADPVAAACGVAPRKK